MDRSLRLSAPLNREVETLFHEFGHALQHMLTQEREGLVSGIRGIEWVRSPMRHAVLFCSVLFDMPRHASTGNCNGFAALPQRVTHTTLICHVQDAVELPSQFMENW